MKKHIAKFAIIFFIVIALLTYFSKTIDNFLLPQVKVTNLETGSLNEQSASNDMKTHYLIPLSSVTSFGSDGTVFVLQTEELLISITTFTSPPSEPVASYFGNLLYANEVKVG